MYSFKQLADYPDIQGNKVPFVEKEWLDFLSCLKGIKPVYLEICDDKGKTVGFFVGGFTKFCGIRILGSPFWGWMGQHMGLVLNETVDKASLIDDLIDYAVKVFRVGYFQMCSFNVEFDDIRNVKHKLVSGERYKTCYIDLTLDEAQLSKNLKSGYRTSIRKFAKDGGYIEEDYSEEFIEEHHRQLEQVFAKVGHKTPNYREKMKGLINSPSMSKGADGTFGVYCIKAMLPIEEDGKTINKNIASSYYIHNNYMAMFFSNASYGAYLRSCPNQALTWQAMMAFKAAGLHYLDMGGSGDYKLNFSGGNWQPKPIIIHCPNCFARFIIIGAKRSYGKLSHLFGRVRNVIKGE